MNNMKRTLYSVLIVALAALTACDNFLTEKTNGKVFSNVLEDQAGLEAALTGAYRQWNGGWSYGFLHTWPYEITMGGEDLTTNATSVNTRELDTYTATNSNSSVACIYPSCYRAVRNASSIIENADKCSGDESVISQILGEAYFIRAYSYFWLARMHKEMPLILSGEYDESQTSMEMTPAAQVYEQIESDLENAIARLGDSRRNNDDGRPNKGTAQAVLAEVYLQEAGFPVEKGASYYAKAAEMAKIVLDNKSAYGFDFEDSYETLFLHASDGSTGGITKENILTLCSRSGDNWMYGTAAGPSQAGGWGYFFAEVGFYNQFPEGVRKEYTFMEEYKCTDGVTRKWSEMTDKHPYYRKMAVDDAYTQGGAVVPICLLRFSQTALTYAEAKARSGGPDAQAYECLNTIRKRAGLSEYSSGMSADDFAEACVDERKWEFASEGVRWWDVVRLKRMQEAMNSRDKSDLSVTGSVTDDRYFIPIPYSEEVLNPNINK